MKTEQKEFAQIDDVELITDNKIINLDENENIPLKTQVDAILYFLQHLDIDMVSCILDGNRTYQKFLKPIFIKKLDDALDEFIKAGDTYLNRYKGFCNYKTCNYKCKGYSFVGNNSGNYFDLIIDVKDGAINDIYECCGFKCETKGVQKNECIEIDKSNLPF